MKMIDNPRLRCRPDDRVTPRSGRSGDGLLRAHARELLAAASEAEVHGVLQQLRADGVDVVRNDLLPERVITTAVGDVAVEVPRIRSRDGEAVNFASSMIPKYLRCSSSISKWTAFAYVKGISEDDVASVLDPFCQVDGAVPRCSFNRRWSSSAGIDPYSSGTSRRCSVCPSCTGKMAVL